MEENSKTEKDEIHPIRRQRLRTVAIVVPAIFALFLWTIIQNPLLNNVLLGPLSEENYRFWYRLITIFILALLSTSGFGFIMMYLQTGFNVKSLKFGSYLDQKEAPSLGKDVPKEYPNLLPSMMLLEEDVAELREQLLELEKPVIELTNDQKSELFNNFQSKLNDQTATSIISEIREEISDKLKKSTEILELERLIEISRERLNNELVKLGYRGNLNLSLGILTAVLGLTILGFFVFESNFSINISRSIIEKESLNLTEIIPLNFMIDFIPRISLVILIEIFAYFFLRLYKSSLSEIKYFQNELTNIELKFLAIKSAISIGDQESINKVITNLSSTERNFILEKGQSTVDLEKAKMEKDFFSEMAKKLANLIPKNS